MKKTAIFLIIILIAVFLSKTDRVWANDNIHFFNLNEEYGLSIRETNQVCSDADGFIWISSKMAIVRYTQDDIRTYHLPYETEGIVEVGFAYRNNILYAYTNDGQVFKYNSIQDKFEKIINISHELRNPYLFVNNLLVDSAGQLFFSTSFGLFCYNSQTGLKVLVKNQAIPFIEWFDDKNFFYVLNDVVKLFDIETLNSVDYFTFPGAKAYKIAHLSYDRNSGVLWIGTMDQGLYLLEKTTKDIRFESVPGIPNQPILAIEDISDSTLFLGVDGQGLWEINKQTKRVKAVYKEDADNPNSLKGNGVYDVYCDSNKRVWICTYTGGVSFFDMASSEVTSISHVANNPNSLINDDVNSVLEDTRGNIWFATNNGVSCWNPKTDRWRTFFRNKKEQAQVFLALCEDDQGHIWAGSYSSGVYVIDISTGNELAHYSIETAGNKFANDFVFDILKDRRGDIWIGGVRGHLICYRAKEKRFESFNEITVNVLQEYGDDKLLIGATYSLLVFDKKTGRMENIVDGYLVYDIYLRNGIVWICTSGSGLLRYDLSDKSLKQFTVDAGLPSNFVNSIEYSNGYLWIGTESGLCRMNEEDNTIVTYNSILELSHVSFNQDSHCLLKNGSLVMGTNRGALIFKPELLKATREEGRIYFQDLSVAGRSIREIPNLNPKIQIDSLKEISLKYFQNTIGLELIPIRVSSPGSKFSWKLDGVDQQWSKPGNNKVLSYSNIPNGKFTLRIRMFDSTMTRVIAERSILIHMIPPFWDTWWFRILLVVFVASLSIFGLLYYIDRLKKQHSEEKIRFFSNTAHDIRTSLTLINGPIEELNKEPHLTDKGLHYLHLATEQAHRLSNVVTQLMDFQKVDVGKEKMFFVNADLVKMVRNRVMMFEALAKSKGLDLVFESNLEIYESSVDETMMEKVIDNLLSNAIKYSYPNTQVQVSLRCFNHRWIFEVQDSGIGISKKAQKLLFREYYRGDNAVNSKIVGSGIGLLLVRNYVSLHGGRITCESQQNEGSLFQVIVPFRKHEEGFGKKEEVKQPIKVFQPVSQTSLVTKEADVAGGPRMKVLVVEDHEYLREFLKSALQNEFVVHLAEDGEKAWDIITKTTPDLVVSDIMMPNMDGFELCRKMKSTYETSHIPIILLTALAGKAQQLQGLGLGADDYLTKPFDITLLQQRIKSIIQNREAIRSKALKMIKAEENEVVLENELNDKFLKRMVEVVRENIPNSQFSKNDFASAMNVSPSLLYKKVKALTDQSPTDFIKIIRLEHSLELLQTRKYTITEVSELCGFASVGYFSTVFRKHYGKSPTQLI